MERDTHIVKSSADKPRNYNETTSDSNRQDMEDSAREQDPEPAERRGIVVCRTPASFSTSAQLLSLKISDFLRRQHHLHSSLSSLSLDSAPYQFLQQYSAVVGFTTHSETPPWIVASGTDPLAQPTLVSLLGSQCGIGEPGAALLDRLDLSEIVGDLLLPDATSSPPLSQGFGRSSSGAVVDMAVSSVLSDTERLAEFAVCSVQSLFQSAGPIPNPHSPMGVDSSSVPVPFHRVCLLLRQHLHWIPMSQMDLLPWQRTERKRGCVIRMCTIGPQGGVRCVSLSCLPLEGLLGWYQMARLCRQLHIPMEPAGSDIHRLLSDILTPQR